MKNLSREKRQKINGNGSFFRSRSLLLLGRCSFLALKEKGYQSGARVGADDRTDILNADGHVRELGLQHVQELLRFGEAVGVQDDADGLLLVGDVLHGLVHDVAHGLLASAHLGGGGQLALAGLGQDGLEVQHRTQHCCCGRDAAAALQVLQVVHREPGLGAELVLLQPGGDGRHVGAGVVHFIRLEHQQGLGGGDGQGVHDGEGALGEALQQVFTGGTHGIDGAGELAGEGDEEDVLAAGENGLEVLLVHCFVQRRGGGGGAGAHLVIEGLVAEPGAKPGPVT